MRSAWVIVVIAVACSTPTTASTTTVDPGAELYLLNCSACHGGDGSGTSAGPSLFDPAYDDLTDADFVAAVELGVGESGFGFGDMAPVVGLTHSEIGAITTYVRSLREG